MRGKYEVWKRSHRIWQRSRLMFNTYYVKPIFDMTQKHNLYLYSRSTNIKDKLIRKNFRTYKSAIDFILILNKLKSN